VFRGYLIAADASRRDWLHALVQETGQALLQVSLDRYPEPGELRNLARQLDPDFVVLDHQHPEAAAGAMRTMRERWPRTAWIGVDGGASGNCAAAFSYPGRLEEMEHALFKAAHFHAPLHPHAPAAKLYAFVPAKAGSGASTVAWNAAHACARQGHRALLLEADLRAGALSFLLPESPSGSTQTALEAAHQGESQRVQMALANAGKIDLLLSARTAPDPPPRWDSFFHLLTMLRPRYDVILADLPELVNAGSSELTRAADGVFVVTTPELLPLKLAEPRCLDLEQWGVERQRLRLLLNRAQRSELSARDVEENLHRPVAETFPNDYFAVRKAALAGGAVDADCALGRSFTRFAQALLPAANRAVGVTGSLKALFGRLREKPAVIA
jgi:pilus assembly protein CpaE